MRIRLGSGRNRQPWQTWFAWRPVKTVEHELVWLETIERAGYYAHHIPVGVPFSIFGCWVYRRAGSNVMAFPAN